MANPSETKPPSAFKNEPSFAKADWIVEQLIRQIRNNYDWEDAMSKLNERMERLERRLFNIDRLVMRLQLRVERGIKSKSTTDNVVEGEFK